MSEASAPPREKREQSPHAPAGARALLSALALSEVGDRFVLAAMPIVALRLDSAVFLAGVILASTVPSVLLSGRVIKVPGLLSARAWRWALFGQMVAWVAAAVTSTVSSWALLLWVLVAGVLEVVSVPYSRAALERVSAGDHEGLTKQWGVAKSLAGAVGMGAGALAATQVGVGWVLLINAATFAITLAIATRIPQLDGAHTKSESGPPASTASSVRLFDPSVFGALGFVVVVTMLCATSLEGVMGPFMLRETVGFDARLLGFVMAAWALGAVAASLLAPAGTQTHPGTFGLSQLCVAIALGLPSLGVNFSWTYLLFFIGGVGNGLFNLRLSRTLWSSVPREQQPAAWAQFNRVLNTTIVLAFVVSLIVEPTGAPELLLAVAGVLSVVALAHIIRAHLDREEVVADA